MTQAAASAKPYKTARVLAVLFIGVIAGIYKHFDQMRWLGRGREAYLADQAHRFDKVVVYHSAAGTLIAWVIIAAVVCGLYELVAAGFVRMLPSSMVEE